MLRSPLIPLATLVALHLLIGLSLIPYLPSKTLAWGFALMLVASCLLMPLGLRARRLNNSVLAWASLLAVGVFSCLAALSLLRALVVVIFLVFGWYLPPSWEQTSALGVLLLTLGVVLIGLGNARRLARVKEVEIAIAGLPPAFFGYTLVQISDIHVGLTIGRRYIQRIVQRVNQLEGDLVAVTGDLVDGGVPQLAAKIAPLAELRGRDGVAVVIGNHEYYSGAPAWIQHLGEMGLPVLLNQHRVIERDGAQLVIAGVTDYSAWVYDPGQASDPAAALRGAPSKAPRILLAHQPRSATKAAAAGFDLQLSGHTHGGQFWPWMYFVRFQQPWVAGLHRLGKLQIYISRGTGYWGPPLRLGAPSEITRIRLLPAK